MIVAVSQKNHHGCSIIDSHSNICLRIFFSKLLVNLGTRRRLKRCRILLNVCEAIQYLRESQLNVQRLFCSWESKFIDTPASWPTPNLAGWLYISDSCSPRGIDSHFCEYVRGTISCLQRGGIRCWHFLVTEQEDWMPLKDLGFHL